MKIYFMRHGEGMDDVEDKYGGWGDLPLSEEGRRQAKESIEKIGKLNIDIVLSSPLKRAMETAEIVGEGMGLDVKKWLYLKERNTYGLMCGESKEEIEEEYPELHNAYENDEWLAGAEKYEDLVKRLEIMMRKIKEFKFDKILAVTHGKVLGAICKEFLGKKLDKKDDCCVLGIEIKDDEYRVVLTRGISFQ